jgi:hypothetical protein
MMPDAFAAEMELLQKRLVVISDETSALELVCDIAAVAKSRRCATPMATRKQFAKATRPTQGVSLKRQML